MCGFLLRKMIRLTCKASAIAFIKSANQRFLPSTRHFSLSPASHFSMKLSEVCSKIEEFGSLSFAEKWDNVGLLVEPSALLEVTTVLLTNDLTEDVMTEAVQKNANLIISYHPPIFQGLKRLTNSHWKERIIVKAIENRIAIYSPHTVWDSVKNGTSEWLANSIPNSTMEPAIPNVLNTSFGAGRICQVDGNFTLKNVIELIKKYTELPDVRVGVSSTLDARIKSYAVCPGSGAGVLKEIKQPIDLFITGEMSHHEVLEANAKGTNVIMLNHSNSERGYLSHFALVLKSMCGDSLTVLISEKDSDPLKTY